MTSSLSAGRLAPHGGSQRVAKRGKAKRAPLGRPLSGQVLFLVPQPWQVASTGRLTR
jgi:hypothetical protein